MSAEELTPKSLRPSYLLQKGRSWAIISAFFVLTIPLCWTFLHFGPLNSKALLAAAIYSVIFELTHFSITWSLYFRSANLKYFVQSKKNILLYFVFPGLAFFFYIISSFLSDVAGLSGSIWFVLIFVRFLDFFHVGRQSVGVLQMFKREAGTALAPVTRKLENLLFVGLALFQTSRAMLRNMYPPQLNYAATFLLFLIFAGILFFYFKALKKSDKRSDIFRSGGYLLVQAAAASLAVYEVGFYSFALAIHNIEYHILIAPRIFKTPLDSSSRMDRAMGVFRKFPILFYLLLLGFSSFLLFATQPEVIMMITGSPSSIAPAITNLFNGIFLAHYVVEAFIWKFKTPHWSNELKTLY